MKKILALIAALSVVMSVVAGGSIAYLTSTDSDKNVMTMGKVEIEQIEDFAQNSALLPNTSVTKSVTVKNTGESEAYVRTFVAFEKGTENVWKDVIEYDKNDTNWTWTDTGLQITVEGVEYDVFVAEYEKALAKDATTEASLKSVSMKASATNDHVKAFGDEYTVLVLTQAVQTAGFNNGAAEAFATAFQGGAGKPLTAAMIQEWFGGDVTPPTEPEDPDAISVASVDELIDAINNNTKATINLADGTYAADNRISIGSGKEFVIKGSKNAVLDDTHFMVTGKLELNGITVNQAKAIANETVSQFSKSAISLQNAGKVICKNVTFNQNLYEGTAISAWWSTQDGANIVVRNCTFNSNGQRPIRSDACVTVDNCTFNDPYRYAVQMTSKSSTMAADASAYVHFNNNTINAGTTATNKPVYGVQLEGDTYGNNNLTINGTGNTINLGSTGKTGAMYYCECGKVDHNTITWNTEVTPVHAAN